MRRSSLICSIGPTSATSAADQSAQVGLVNLGNFTFKLCSGCFVKMKLPPGPWADINVSSLSSHLNESDEDSFIPWLDLNPFTRTGSFSRKSLKVRPVQEEGVKFCRSQTLSKAEAKAARERTVNRVTTSSICLQCRNELASVIWGKKSPRSPS